MVEQATLEAPEEKQFKYDVAFSFLAEDEEIATALNDLLQDRLSTFLYARRQEEIAGTDGGESLSRVFADESRLVVVLYRTGWGETPWTRIEKEGIRNRAFDKGYDFVTFIPLDDSPTVPNWLPKTRLWIGLKRWGLEGAASVIEARAHEAGGAVHVETVAERGARLTRQLQFDEFRRRFLGSDDGVRSADAGFEQICFNVEQLAAAASMEALNLRVNRQGPRVMELVGPGCTLTLGWDRIYSNSLKDAQLDIVVWRGPAPGTGRALFEKPIKISANTFEFDILTKVQMVWRRKGDKQTLTSEELASWAVKALLETIEKERRRK